MKHAWKFGIGVVIVVILAFTFFALKTSEGVLPSKDTDTTGSTITSLARTYKNSTHTITGLIMVPTACTTVTATAKADGTTAHVDLAVSTDDGVCLELPTATPFSVSFTGPALNSTTVYINGSEATSTSP